MRLLQFVPGFFLVAFLAAPLAVASPLTGSETASLTEGASERRTDVRLERVSFARRSDGRGYVMRLHTTAAVPRYRLSQNGAEIRLDLSGVKLAPEVEQAAAPAPVREYRLERRAAGGVRLVMTVANNVDAQAYPDRDRPHLLVALTTATSPAEASADRQPPSSAVGWGNSSDSPPRATSSTSPPSPEIMMPDLAGTDHWRLDRIVIDAGHGGHDGGATHNGIEEKDITLGIARKLGRMIEQDLGIEVIYTRKTDRFVELHERGRIANESGGKLFISIHANAASSESAHGTETYFLAPHRTESAREVMERENSVVRLESAPELYADFDDEDGIMQALSMSAYQEDSQTLARLIETEFGTSRRSRGVKQAGFLVLWRASMPAVLVETGFVSNDDEARFLRSERGQQQTAREIFEAVRAYASLYERGLSRAERR